VHEAAPEQAQHIELVTGIAFRVRRAGFLRLRGLRARLEIMQGGDDIDSRRPVDRRMVNLQEQRKAAWRQAFDVVQPFDHVRLPERMRAIERTRMQSCDLDAELAPVSRLRQCDVPHVEFDVGIFRVGPERVIDVQRHLHELAGEHRRTIAALAEHAQDILESYQATARGRRIVDEHRADMHRRIVGFRVQEHRILTAQLLHETSPQAMSYGSMYRESGCAVMRPDRGISPPSVRRRASRVRA
jgi:hypothetical protein